MTSVNTGCGPKGPAMTTATINQDILQKFLNALVNAHGLAPATQRAYREKLRPLFAAWEDIPIEEWDYPLFEDFIAAQDWAPRTRHKFCCCCRKFIRWAQSRKMAVQNFVGSYKAPRAPATAPRVISRGDLIALLRHSEGHRMEVVRVSCTRPERICCSGRVSLASLPSRVYRSFCKWLPGGEALASLESAS